MKTMCFYYDDRNLEYRKTSLKELKRLMYTDKQEFLHRTATLFRFENDHVPMILVKKGPHQGFRRKGNGSGNRTPLTRGESESTTHQGNKEVIAELDELTLMFYGQNVKIFYNECEMEKGLICNGSYYEPDITMKLDKTEPAEYFDLWNGVLYFELFHTCPVDTKQAEDFAIEGKALFEFKIPSVFGIVDNISEEGLIKRKAFLTEKYQQNGVRGLLICSAREESLSNWKISKKGNWTCNIGDEWFTIIKSQYGENFGIKYGDKKLKWDYNGKKFLTIEDAKKNADYLAFKLYNNQKI